MPTTIYLIRHGETENAEQRRYKGHIDVPLSAKGELQLEDVASRLSSVSLSAVYTSDLKRARRSAEIVAKPHNIEPVIDIAFKERNFGRWEGLTFKECRERFPEEFEAWVKNPVEASPVGGESTLDVKNRLIPALEELLLRKQRNETSSISIVAHGGVNRIILCHLLGMPLQNIFRIEQDFGALNIIEIWDETPVVKLINGIYYNGTLKQH